MTIGIRSERDIARELAADFATRATEADERGELPADDISGLRDSGYLGMVVPTEYGGAGLPMQDILAAHLELSQGSTSTAIVAAMTLQVIGNARETQPWSPENMERLCRAVAQEGALVNAVASEPAMGSPSRGAVYASHAKHHPEGWILNGHKNWITGGAHLTHLLVKLMVEDEPGTILVESDRPGLAWETTWGNAMSLRASDSHDLYLNDVIVPAENLFERGKVEKPHPNAWFPMLLGAIYLGAGLGARRTVVEFALERIPTALGEPIATLPKIQRQIGEIDMQLQAARALLLEVATEWETYPEKRAELYPRIAAAKHFAVEVANAVTDKALQIAGGQALSKSLPLERYFRDVRAGHMQPPSGDTALEVIGRGAIDAVKRPSQA